MKKYLAFESNNYFGSLKLSMMSIFWWLGTEKVFYPNFVDPPSYYSLTEHEIIFTDKTNFNILQQRLIVILLDYGETFQIGEELAITIISLQLLETLLLTEK